MINWYRILGALAMTIPAACSHDFLYPGTPEHCSLDGDCPAPFAAPECSHYECGPGDGDTSLVVAGCFLVTTKPGDLCNAGVGFCSFTDPKDPNTAVCNDPVVPDGTTCTMPQEQGSGGCSLDSECDDGSDCTIDTCVLASQASEIHGWCLHTNSGPNGAPCEISFGGKHFSDGICTAGACCAGN